MSHTPADPAPTHWAILIGVGMSIDSRAELGDEKQAWRRDQSLEGAVADIHMMERYLKDDPRVKISKLTATKPTHGTEKNTPLEPPEDQPTRKNVESLLKTIIKEGLSRNIHHVYIHFSGHGTDSSDGTFALSLFDPGPLGRVRFLTDHLATALQRITRQGIRVTVVLDCCFSGSMKRSSDVSASHVRFIEHDPSEDLMETENPFLEADTEGSRQAYLNLPHLLDPKGYVVITACGPRENAREVKLENGKRHGALSYFLHDSLMLLRRSEDQVSFETLYNRLQAKFHVNLPQQTPRHYGNMRESFFQNLSCQSSRYLVTTVKVPDQEEFILKAGEAHGVHKGDQYEAYPYYASEVNSKALRKESVLLVVKEVENLQSKVMPVDHDQLERFKEVMTWKAQLITSKSDRKTLIYASKSLGVAEKDRLRKYLSNHPYVKLLEEDGDLGVSTFNISINNDESYEIREGDSRRAPNTPLFPRNEEDSLNLLSDALGHLATYKFFEGIENSHPDKGFGKSLDIETHSTPGPDQCVRCLITQFVPSILGLFNEKRAIRLLSLRVDNKYFVSWEEFVISITINVEDYRKGYPRFSALMAAHETFHILRRFSNARMRLLLHAQDRVVQLEERLDKIDNDETSPLFLSSRRRDKNYEREKTMKELHDALESLDQQIERHVRISAFKDAHPQDVNSLRNWSKANPCITRQELAFLGHEEDLLCLSAPNDDLLSFLQRYVTERLLGLSGYGRSAVSRDRRVHFYSQNWTTAITRTLVTPLIITMVMVPITICNQIESEKVRLGITIISTSLFLLLLSLFTRGKMLELTVAAATYTTVLVAFISGPT
ncbi:hypothetical protein FVEG_17320 [Fusarium verticillioides 7600]|uniref:Uncharacterized protein n=1 Tax=Gibberella moniliformis (strain M3125 / FGSC 7600) TaxID=334819 RepID=W7NDR1_GIBM7|nr:hypothetical protein FVEG_17320 [Fusarium verticillioides 7600]EWG54442.1 hypothetical protein FVEG_17320 [Fusarium verticillioides 7600]